MRLAWSREALADKEAIWHFLADRNPDYADRTERRLEARTGSLRQMTNQGRPSGGSGLRLLSIPDIQLVVAYRVEEDEIRIMAVRSTAQDEIR